MATNPNTENAKNAPAQEEKKSLPFNVVEAYKNIRMNLVFMLSQSNKKSFVVSSFEANDGKSTTAVNIAKVFAQLGNNVVLIDADMRKPSVHKKMKLPNTKGLSSILVGFCNTDEAIQHIGKNLDVITSGPIPPNQSEMLCSGAMKMLMKELEEKYDYVIFDTPPFGIVSDALVFAPQTAGIVMVARSGMTTTEQVKRSVVLTETAGVKILGCVINAAKNGERKYKYYRRYYKYGYSYYRDYREPSIQEGKDKAANPADSNK